MAKEVNPQDTARAAAFALWMNAPNPMVTFFKTLDVTGLVRVSGRKGLKFNMLLCYCIGKAAAPIREFYLLPVGGRLMQYESLAVSTWEDTVLIIKLRFRKRKYSLMCEKT